MSRLRNTFIAGALLALGLASAADAASLIVCQPGRPGVTPGPGQFKAAASGNLYTLDARGCTVAAYTDIGDFNAAGFIQNGAERAIIVSGVTAQAQIGTLPASAVIRHIIAQETSGHAVTGGLKWGSTAGGTDIVSGMNVASSGYTVATDASIAKRIFGSSTAAALWVDAVTAWNSANVTVTVIYSYF